MFEPRDIICIGRNYFAADVSEAERARVRAALRDADLEVFLKPSTAALWQADGRGNRGLPPATMSAPDLHVVSMPSLDGDDADIDAEAELAVVIGRESRNVSEAAALDCVSGYTIALDVTARRFQTASGPPLWMRGKGFDGFCPLGPTIVAAGELRDPTNLLVRTTIAGVVTREARTRDMIRGLPQIIAALSRHMTLRAGAVILTGAPPPLHRSPPPAAKPGDEIIGEIEGIGALRAVIAPITPTKPAPTS